jgi:hypothetical protein
MGRLEGPRLMPRPFWLLGMKKAPAETGAFELFCSCEVNGGGVLGPVPTRLTYQQNPKRTFRPLVRDGLDPRRVGSVMMRSRPVLTRRPSPAHGRCGLAEIGESR